MAASRRLAWLLAGCVLVAQEPGAAPVDPVLKRVDLCRYPWPSFLVDVGLKDGSLSQDWRVQVRENGDARVEGLSEKEKGRAVLLLGDQMWLLLPGAKRPVKVSPQQRLMGPAAGGDIARFRFAADYTVAKEQEEVLEDKPLRRLELQARRKAVSYQMALLWTTREGAPVRADFFFASGKLARTARFGPLVAERGAQVLSSILLEEPSGRKVELRFTHWKPATFEDSLFELPAAK